MEATSTCKSTSGSAGDDQGLGARGDGPRTGEVQKGPLRSHDAEGLPPATLVFEEGIGLVGDITRSKTTGLGKKVEVVQMYISVDAFVFHPKWLRTGLVV